MPAGDGREHVAGTLAVSKSLRACSRSNAAQLGGLGGCQGSVLMVMVMVAW
jgi:hypothetical protein